MRGLNCGCEQKKRKLSLGYTNVFHTVQNWIERILKTLKYVKSIMKTVGCVPGCLLGGRGGEGV